MTFTVYVLVVTPFCAVKSTVMMLPPGTSEKLWLAVRGNIQRLGDVEIWRRICEEPVAPVIECPEFAAGAALLLPEEPWDEGTWGRWTAAVKQVTGHSGRGLFHPLRLALTARGDGPELKLLLPIMGRARALARLQGATG